MAAARKAKGDGKKYMSDEAFGELREALEDALAYERGGRRDLRVTRVAVPRPRPTHATRSSGYGGGSTARSWSSR